jgi:UDP-GlcNAc:undecaprenyl-phosphate GlcNAc-1-phosphate transferase
VIRWGTLSKPSVGGLSFYISFLLSVACYSVFFSPSQVFYNASFIGLLLSMALSFIIGLADDAYDTKPLLKFSVQVLCGVSLVITGIHIDLFDIPELNYLLTIFWVVGIMNSINMLDNMDGITGLVSIGVVASAIMIILLHRDFESMHLIILVGIFSALLSFLYYNWNPSKMYMGDTGSQFLGAFLAAIGIMYFWNDHYRTGDIAPARQFIMASLAFILPIIDTTVVVVNRISRGRSPFVGGKDHTTHSLAYLGLTDRQVALTYLLMSLVSLMFIYFIETQLTEWSHFYSWLFGAYFIVLLGFFFIVSRKVAQQREASGVIKKV